MAYKKYSKEEKDDYFNGLTEKVDDYLKDQSQKIIDYLENNGGSKKQVWENPIFSNNAIGNPCTGISYSFENTILLALVMQEKGYKSPHFVTAKQAFDNGMTMEKGTTGHFIIQHFGRKLFALTDKDANGNEVQRFDEDGNPLYAYRRQSKLVKVFNLEQLKGEIPKAWLNEKIKTVLENEEDILAVRDIAIAQSPAPIERKATGYNCYSPTTKKIYMHESENFKSSMHEISTLFHEQAHVTGDEEYYKRECFKRYGESDFFRGQEELVANLTAKKLLQVYGISENHLGENFDANHDVYNNGWGLAVFKQDPMGIFQAADMADRAFKLISGKIDSVLKNIPELSHLVSKKVEVSEDEENSNENDTTIEKKKTIKRTYKRK